MLIRFLGLSTHIHPICMRFRHLPLFFFIQSAQRALFLTLTNSYTGVYILCYFTKKIGHPGHTARTTDHTLIHTDTKKSPRVCESLNYLKLLNYL